MGTSSRGAFLVVVGPDGVGKTAVARAVLAEVGSRGRYFHFIPSPLHVLAKSPPVETPQVEEHSERGSRVLGILRLGRSLGRAWIAYILAIRPAVRSGSIVVGDRWLYGYGVQPSALKFYGPEWVARLMLRLMPRPDLVFVLAAPAEVIRDRKAELSVAQIEAENVRWAHIRADNRGRTVTLDATRPSGELADEILNRVSRGSKLRRYPPTLGHVLLPGAPRSAALAGSTLYAAARPRGLAAQRLGRGMIRAFGTSWLPIAHPGDIPLRTDHWDALVTLVADHGIHFDSFALHTRTQGDRKGYSVLVISNDRPAGFVRVGAPDTLEMERRALEMLNTVEPETFRPPRLLGGASSGGVDFVLLSAVLEGSHRPPRRPPLDEIVREIQVALGQLPKPPDTPCDWRPMHGDFTPWNLRQVGDRISLIDWESAGWGPPFADQTLYVAASEALRLRRPARSWNPEACSFWLERIGEAEGSRDARLRSALLKILERGGSHHQTRHLSG